MDNLFNDETLLARWLEGKLTEPELEALRQREEYADLVKIVATMESFAAPEFDENARWEILKNKLSEIKPEPVSLEQPEFVKEPAPLPIAQPVENNAAPPLKTHHSKLITLFKALAIAAGVALLAIAGWWFMQPEEICRQVAAADKQELKLPDGSQVNLNAESSICFPVKVWKSARYVELEGEAYFRVKKGKTFTVRTDFGNVQVVGTVFNVYAREEELEVTCSEGKVQVISPDGTQRALAKEGEMLRVVKGRLQPREGLWRNPTWFKGESAFRSAPLEKVFGELERQFGLEISADSVDLSRLYSGKFLHGDLQKALKMVCDPMQLQYETQENKGKKTVRLSQK